MKKQIKKLSLNKKTISNLTGLEMSNKIGGGSQGYCGPTNGDDTTCRHCGYTKNQNLQKMKKQFKKLSLNKRTISNLNEMEMKRKVGGSDSYFGPCGCAPTYHCTKNQKTCPGHKTCYAC